MKIEKIQNFTSNTRTSQLLKLLIRSVVLFLVYIIAYKYLRYNIYIHVFYENITYYLTRFLLYFTTSFLNLIGFDAHTLGKIIWLEGYTGIYLDRGCLGRTVLASFIGLLIVFPGNIKSKLWFIPFGTIIINLLNVIRIGALVVIAAYWPEYLDINHHYVFKLVVWLGIFILWFFWLNKYGGK